MTRREPSPTPHPNTNDPDVDTDAAIIVKDVVLVRDGSTLLGPISWRVRNDERWVVLGPNGCGKSTLLKVASMHLHPTQGTVTLLGEHLGRTDVRALRSRVGYSSAALAESFRPTINTADVVMTALNGALEPWWHTYTDADRSRARMLLGQLGCQDMADRPFNTLSSGERQRVLLARTLMTDPGIVMLDEPTAALDLAGRERLLTDLDALAAAPNSPALALVTHHVEEIPSLFTHCLMIRDGQEVISGPIDDVLTSANVSDTFGIAVTLERHHNRWLAFSGPEK